MKTKNPIRKKHSTAQWLKLLGVLCLGLASQPLRAGDQTFNFDTDPSLDPAFKLVGNNAPSAWWATGGNPDTGGYLELTPALGGQNLCIVFPDVDNGFPVKAFKLTLDCRVGNGTTERPADGFSISYCRESDLVLLNATNGVTGGAAGGDSAADCTGPTGSGDLENGTRTGVSIVFDAWAGNWWADTGAGGVPGPDSEGLAVRVDDKTLYKSDFSGNRNGNCTAAGGADITGCAAAAAADATTMQTGPWANDGGTVGVLTWQPLSVELDTNKQVTVIWKGVNILNKFQLSQYSPHVGRLVLMGRTGGNNQNVNFDNIRLVTIPSGEATFGTLVSVGQNGFKFTLDDIGASIVTNVPLVKLDGVDVTTQCTVTKVGKQTTVSYTQAARLVSLSTHTVDATWQTTLNQTLSANGQTFKVDSYSVLPVANALPLSAVSGQPRGMALGQTWQTVAGQPNTLPWTEMQLLGLQGPNLITGTWPTSTEILDYQNAGPEGTANGNFQVGGSTLTPPLWDGADLDVKSLGFGSDPSKLDTDNSTIEWFTYVNFPTAGNYTMIVNSDDGFRLTTARNAKDRMGTVVSFFEGGRGNGTGLGAGTPQTVIVEQAGVYPIRGFIQNGGGGFNVEWYTQVGTNLYLVNSNSTPESLQAWQNATAAGCYVQSAIPVRDGVGVLPGQKIIVDLANGATTVNAGTIAMKVDGVAVSPVFTGLHLEVAPTSPGGIWATGSKHTNELTFADSGGATYSYSWSFTVVPFKTLPTDLRLPLGSGNSSKLGFVVRAQQTDHVAPIGNMANNNTAAESDLAGLFGPNLADLTGVDASGNFIVTDWINWDRGANDGSGGENGNFKAANGYPEAPLPGITPTSGGTGTLFENLSEGVQTYVEFPTTGFYQMGVNSDDNFKVTLAKGPPPPVLSISGPANKALGVLDMSLVPDVDGGGRVNYGTNPPVIPLTTPLVYLTPAGLNDPGPYPDCTGKIVLLDRGGTALGTTSSGGKALAAQNRGAVAVIFTTPGDQTIVFYAGATRTDIHIPVLMIRDSTDGVLLRSYFTAGTPVTATIHGDPSFVLGGFDNGRGATDTIMSFWAEAGIYPMRMVFQQGGGGGNCEWFSVKSTGAKVLLNDTAAGGLKTFQAVNEPPKFNPPTVSGNVVSFTWTGTGILQQATSLTGSPSDWTDVSPQPPGNSYSVPATGARMFLRLR